MSSEPKLRQSVKWGEAYVSRGLNEKFYGVIPPGVYRGYLVKPGGQMAVLVENDPLYPKSVAVVERNGYSISVFMDGGGLVPIPAKGTWYICIEALYTPESSQGYQRLVAREAVEDHHVVLAKVHVDGEGLVILEGMIDLSERQDADLSALREDIDKLLLLWADWSAEFIRLSDRVTRNSLALAELQVGSGGTVIIEQTTLPCEGVSLCSGVTVAPLTISEDGAAVPGNAALIAHIEKYTD